MLYTSSLLGTTNYTVVAYVFAISPCNANTTYNPYPNATYVSYCPYYIKPGNPN